MSVQYKNFTLREASYMKSIENMYWFYSLSNVICTQWRLNYDNFLEEDASSTVGDAVITDEFACDGDLIISVGYNDGFAIRKILDDGTFATLYTNTSIAGGAGCTNFGISKTHKKVFISYYARTTGTEIFDYSNFVTGGTGPIIELGIKTTVNSEIPTNQAGNAITNGFAVAGDYLYMMQYAATSTMPRWNFETDTDAPLTVTNKSSDGYRGQVFYHEPSDRIFANWYYNGELWVTVSASTAGAECYQVDLASIYGGNDVRTYMSVPLKDNHNHMWQMNYIGATALIDITTPINGGSSAVPTKIKWNTNMGTKYNYILPYFFLGGELMYAHEFFDSDLILLAPYSNRHMNYGWYDQEHAMPVSAPSYYVRNDSGGYSYQVEDGDNSQLKYAYGPQAKVVTSSGQSNSYYVVSGYGGVLGSYKFRSWSVDTSGFSFYDSGNIVFGDFELDDNSNIEVIKVDIPYSMIYILTETDITCSVSNNNGVDWESYNYSGVSSDYVHKFSSSGNIAQVKLNFTGTPTKSAHISGMDSITVSIQGVDVGSKWNTRIPSQIKIKGSI